MVKKPLVSIVTAGLSKFGRLDGMYCREIFAEAAKEAFDRCPNLDPVKDIEALFVGHMGESYEHQGHTGAAAADWTGLLNIPATRTEAACASSGAALRSGVYAVLSGLADIVLVGGVEKMTHRTTAEATEYLAMASDYPFEQWHGFTFPALYALMATAHMYEYGTTEAQMAAVAVKNHYHGTLNPKAHLQKEITLEKAQNALGVIPEKLMVEFMKILEERDIHRGMEFLDKLWEESLNVENFFKDLAGFVKEMLIKQEIEGERGLRLIGDIYDTLTKFKFEEDKRLLGYVILNKNIFAGKAVSAPEVVYREVVREKEAETQGEAKVETAPQVDIDISIDQVKRVWTEALNMAKREKMSMAAFLAGAHPLRVEKNIIYIGFSFENSFSKDMMEKAENNKYLLEALRTIIHPSVETRYELIGQRKAEKKEENVSFADKVVEFFDGELI